MIKLKTELMQRSRRLLELAHRVLHMKEEFAFKFVSLKKVLNCRKQICSTNLERKVGMEIGRNEKGEERLRVLGIGETINRF